MSTHPPVTERLRGAVNVLYREIIKFGVVGVVSFVVDVGLMNVLRQTVMEDKPTGAKIVSASVATAERSAPGSQRTRLPGPASTE